MKNVDSLRKSREQRATILEMFGGELPQSILKHDKSIQAIDLHAGGSYKKTANDGGHTGKLKDVFDISGQGAEALSRFPQNVGRKLLLFYTAEGDLVIDPFAGHNSRMEFCWRNNRHYAGNDICAQFIEADMIIAEMLHKQAANDMFGPEHLWAEIRLTQGDSRRLPYADGEGDFTITSPPYWDIEYYGPEPGQLGTGKTYDQFLAGLAEVARENYRVLRPGAFCVWCVNHFRRNGDFYPFHRHTAELMEGAGFIQHDEGIIDLGPAIRAAFAQQTVETRILPKRHEYALVFRKPGTVRLPGVTFFWFS